VDARGSWFADTLITGERPHVVTESVPFRGTFTMTWTPQRAGNWLFHCHDALHTSWRRRYNLIGERPPATLPMHDAAHHAEQDMSGLVLGIRARDRVLAKARARPEPQRRIHLRVNETAGFYGNEPGFSYASGATTSAADSVWIPAQPLILTRGERAAITVVNRLSIPTAVHWHGIELESFYDGVAGWSGDDIAKAPFIAPRDSFVVHMTPPRAGTFIFHAHVDDMRQMALGLYGALIVLPPGETWDPATQHLFIVSQLGRGRSARTGLNGSTTPAPIRLATGKTHRFRFINISIEDDADFTLQRDSTTIPWRALAKDGADLAASRAVERPAAFRIAPGETYDFEVTLQPGTYRLQMSARDSAGVVLHVQ
jgi:FtsP/CotA-like multicopper oxidase with cupredoxin domain